MLRVPVIASRRYTFLEEVRPDYFVYCIRLGFAKDVRDRVFSHFLASSFWNFSDSHVRRTDCKEISNFAMESVALLNKRPSNQSALTNTDYIQLW